MHLPNIIDPHHPLYPKAANALDAVKQLWQASDTIQTDRPTVTFIKDADSVVIYGSGEQAQYLIQLINHLMDQHIVIKPNYATVYHTPKPPKPLCFGDDDCSSLAMSTCRWVNQCGVTDEDD